MRPSITDQRQSSSAWPKAALAAIPRFFVGLPSLFYGVEHLLHPEYLPGVPLQKLTPDWIPGRIFLSYFVGVILIIAGVCLLVNKKTRMTAQVTALYPSFLTAALTVGINPFVSALSLAYFSNLNAAMTHYGTGSAPVYFGVGYVSQGAWWKVGFLISLVNLALWLVLGLLWWKLLGWW